MNITRSLSLGSIVIWSILHTSQLLAAGDVTPENADGFIVLEGDEQCRVPIKESVYMMTGKCRYFSIDHNFHLENVRSAVTIVLRAISIDLQYRTATIKTIKDKVSTPNMTFNQLIYSPPNKPFFPGLLFIGVAGDLPKDQWLWDIVIHMDK